MYLKKDLLLNTNVYDIYIHITAHNNRECNNSRKQTRIKKTKLSNSKNKIVFCSKYNPLGPNIKDIIQKHTHIFDNCQIMQNKEIMVAHKCEKNLKE